MSWYQSLNGASVNLSPNAVHNIGLSGVGAEDLGVLELADDVSGLFRLGLEIGALDREAVEQLCSSEPGTIAQRKLVEQSGSSVLSSLSQRVEDRVCEKLGPWFPLNNNSFVDYRDWGQQCGWEFPVLFGPDDVPSTSGLRIADEFGLRVMECPVAGVPGLDGDVFCAFTEYLTQESLKRTGTCILQERLMMYGIFVEGISTEALDSLEGLSGVETRDWFKTNASEGLEELSGYSDDEEVLTELLAQVQDVLVATHQVSRRVSAVVGDEFVDDSLAVIREKAASIENEAHRAFVVGACGALDGVGTQGLIDGLPMNHFERYPGEFCVVDLGLDLGESAMAMYQEINEMAYGGEDFGWIPLEGQVDRIVDVMVRITLAERILLGLAALLD